MLRRLNRFGYTAYLAGGGVRDIILGREPKDFDIVTNATPEEIKNVFRNAILIGRRFRIAHIRFKGEIIEVATFRSLQPPIEIPTDEAPTGDTPSVEGTSVEKKEEDENTSADEKSEKIDSRHKVLEERLHSEDGLILRDNVWGTPEEDAFRRDFTVNALFYSIKDFSIIDYTGGMDDLINGKLRLIGDPDVRYIEDPVRMLRAVRFSAKLGFEIEETSYGPLCSLKEDILKANKSRLYEELLKVWLSDEAEKGFQLMRKTGLFGVLFPEVEKWLSYEEDGCPHTFMGKAFEWIENEMAEGRKISPALLFAIILSGPIRTRAKELKEETGSRQPLIFPAVKEAIEAIRDRISIPKRDVEAIKAILYGEQRFPQTKGKRPHTWLRNQNFSDAYRYFKMKQGLDDGGHELVKWWENFVSSNRGKVPEVTKRKSYRRKRKPRQ